MVDTCRIATVNPSGALHCVPIGYFYHEGTIYMATKAGSRKARNIKQNPECCVLVDTVVRGRGKGLMLTGEDGLVKGDAYQRLKGKLERLAGWHLDKWDIGGGPPDSIIVFRPRRIVEIGRV